MDHVSFCRRTPLLRAVILGLVVAAGISSCGHLRPTDEQAKVTRAFASWKNDMISYQTDRSLAYIPSHVDNYLDALNAGAGNSFGATTAGPSPTPGVDLLLRTALERKVPADLRPHLTLSTLMKRITDRHLFNPRDVTQIDLGPVSIEGNHASADVYYQGTLTALRLPFIKEGNDWKIDVMALLPYAEVLMRLDRAVKNETQAEQVDQLVSKLPSL